MVSEFAHLKKGAGSGPRGALAAIPFGSDGRPIGLASELLEITPDELPLSVARKRPQLVATAASSAAPSKTETR